MVALTHRECQVLKLVCAGLLNKEIAHELGMSVSTVKGYIGALIALDGFTNRVQVARWAHFHPEVFRGNLVDTDMHLPPCPCEHPECVGLREI